MKSKISVSISILMLLILAFTVGSERAIQAQGDLPDAQTAGEIQTIITPLMSYQGRLVEGGKPVTGTRTMIFRLFNVSSGGTAFWTETKSITVADGLFQTALGSSTPFNETILANMDQNLWLEIEVGGVKLPRQQLMGAPYAFALAPGAQATGSMSSPILTVQNDGTNDASLGINVVTNGIKLGGSALIAEAKNASGISLHAINSSTSSWDATLVTSNQGIGPLIKGFGGDGGEHEFLITNDGTFQQELGASGLVKAGVFAWCAATGYGVLKSFNNVGGSIDVVEGDKGTCIIDFGFDVSDRYFMVTAPIIVPEPGAFSQCLAMGRIGGPPTQLACLRYKYDGTLTDGYIMILVY